MSPAVRSFSGKKRNLEKKKNQTFSFWGNKGADKMFTHFRSVGKLTNFHPNLEAS